MLSPQLVRGRSVRRALAPESTPIGWRARVEVRQANAAQAAVKESMGHHVERGRNLVHHIAVAYFTKLSSLGLIIVSVRVLVRSLPLAHAASSGVSPEVNGQRQPDCCAVPHLAVVKWSRQSATSPIPTAKALRPWWTGPSCGPPPDSGQHRSWRRGRAT